MLPDTSNADKEANAVTNDFNHDNEEMDDSKRNICKGFLSLCSQTNKIDQIKIILLLVAFGIDMLHLVNLNLLKTTLIAWLDLSPVQLGYFTGITLFGNGLMVFALAELVQKYVNEHLNMILSSISGMLGPLIMAFATSEWHFYVGE